MTRCTWTRQRWIIAFGQQALIAVKAPCPPSRTTQSGSAILRSSCVYAWAVSCLAQCQAMTWSWTRCHEQASGGGVGAVDEDLIVNALRITVVGDVDKPKRFESTVKCPTAHLVLLGEFRQRRYGGRISNEGFKVAGQRAVAAGSCRGAAAVRVLASPPGCAFGCGSVFLYLPSTYRAPWSVFYSPGKHTNPRLAHAGAIPED